MERYAVGDVIVYSLMPWFRMTIMGVKDCEMDASRPEQHAAYQVIDPEGNEDWLCAYDVQRFP